MISSSVLKHLDFQKILSVVSCAAHSTASEEVVREIIPFRKREDIELRCGQVQEIRSAMTEGNTVCLEPFSDVTALIRKVNPQGSLLEGKELCAFIPVLEMVLSISHLMKASSRFPLLQNIFLGIEVDKNLISSLKRTFDDEGNIRDNATFELAEIRRQKRRLETTIGKKLEEMTRDPGISVFLQDDFVTKRARRWVIPVRMDSKGMVAGVVHDVSHSGETAFIEPLGILDLSNRLENISAEEKAEEIRILRELSSTIRGHSEELATQFQALVHVDVLNCIAVFAERLGMAAPSINDSGIIKLLGARHPLLMLSRTEEKDGSVVPLDMTLGGEERVMVITGSNAGGKTIAIKTAGLLLLMALSGMPVPADSYSSFPLAQNVLIDIGDEQSIESNLSTFAAHMSNLSEIVRDSDEKTLVLIDELGTGTDPDEGAALSCAILAELLERGSLVLATTHLAGIKGYAHTNRGMLNASMEFDKQTLRPLYRLRVGEPGQSHALAIARQYGLPEKIIRNAGELLGKGKADFDSLISELNEKRAEYEKKLQALIKEKEEISGLKKSLDEEKAQARRMSREITANAHREALELVSSAKREMHDLLEEIKQKDKSELKKAIKDIAGKQELISRKIRDEFSDEEDALDPENIHTGDTVYVRSLGRDAEIVSLNSAKNRIKVVSEGREIEVPVSEIAAGHGDAPPSRKSSVILGGDTVHGISSRLNIIGMRVDEALSVLEPFLNHAVLEGLTEVLVVHGIGKGLLSKAVREHLTRHPLVRNFRKGDQTEGGQGVTIVTLIDT